MVISKLGKRSIGDTIFITTVWFILGFTFVTVLLPFIHIIAGSFSSAAGVARGIYLWPRDFSVESYRAIFRNDSILRSYLNSFIYVIVGSSLNTALTMLAAYPLSRKKLKGRNIMMFLFSFTMLFSGGLIPTYLVVVKLGLIDTIWALVLVGAVDIWLLIVTRTFIQQTIPEEFYEAAIIDGCSDFRILWNIVLPLSKAVIAVCVLRYAVMYWNGYFTAMVYLRTKSKYPLQLVLRSILFSANIDLETLSMLDTEDLQLAQYLAYLLKYSCIVVATVPMLILYPFLQKYFVKGMMVGAIKG